MNKRLLMGGALAVVLFTGCGTTVNMSDYQTKVRQIYQVPDVCKAEYKSLKDIPRVAVLPFANNSSLSKANTSHTNANASYQHASATGIGVGANGIGVAHASAGKIRVNRNTTSRVVDPKLDKSITSALEGKLAEMGGVDIYSREDLNKIMKEQKFQQSGLVDENTIVQLGKLAGVRYIVTGSIDSVTQEYKDYEKAANATANATANNRQNQSLANQLFGAALRIGASALSGMKITTRVTFKVIDVKTGKIVASVQKEETKNIGKIPNPTYEQVIGGIKDDIMKALDDTKEELSDFFGVRGYITQVKTDAKRKNYIAQINVGKKDKVKPGQTFSVYTFEENEDPVTHKITCDKITMNVKLKVSDNQLQQTNAWTIAEGDDAPKIRAGQIVKRDKLSNSLISF